MSEKIGPRRASTEKKKPNQAVKVYVRIRPSKNTSCLTCSDTNVFITNPRNEKQKISYSFNGVFNEETSQESLFEQLKPSTLEILQGRNVTIFAYGQTGSGKTFTMNGTETGVGQGVMPRIVRYLLETNESIEIHASYLEIYNEKIFDLLSENERTASSYLDLRETNEKEIIIAGANSVKITTLKDFHKYHSQAMNHRSTASTKLNQESSRSHFILKLTIKIDKGSTKLISKVHLIDLAGSEDNKRTGNSGDRMNESCAINKSLFVLGQVVEALNKNATRVPYRDSKVTRILQDSLGGSSLGIILACCAPDQSNFIDTYNTLNFATKSSLIKNTVVVNEISTEPVDRKQALLDWKDKNNRPSTGNLKKKPRSSIQSDRSSISSVDTYKSKTGYEQNTSKRKKSDLSAADEEIINAQVEKRLKMKLQELSGSILSQDEIQRIVTDRFAMVEQRLDQKLLQAIKKNPKLKENNPPAVNIITSSSKSDLDSLKETTKMSMLNILNNGNLKTLMSLRMIGKKRAELILESREKDGKFEDLNDLQRAGIKPTTISSIFKANISID